jgi:hypothetical protein
MFNHPYREGIKMKISDIDSFANISMEQVVTKKIIRFTGTKEEFKIMIDYLKHAQSEYPLEVETFMGEIAEVMSKMIS